MELFKLADYIKKANPEPDKRLTLQLLEKKAENMVGMFIILPPGGQTPYHFHNKRESILIVISGTAKELVEGKTQLKPMIFFSFLPNRSMAF